MKNLWTYLTRLLAGGALLLSAHTLPAPMAPGLSDGINDAVLFNHEEPNGCFFGG